MKHQVAGLLVCLVGSISAHGLLVLSAWAPPHNWSPSRDRAARPALAMRMLAPPQPVGSGTSAAGGRAEVPPLLLMGPIPVAPSLAPQMLPWDESDLAMFDRSPMPSLPEGDESGYIPRPRLTVPPILRAPVALVWPDDGLWTGHFNEVLTLYIDEQGLVQRVEPEGRGLPEGLRDLARQAFLGASFAPGQLNGEQVKSKIRIEVNFDADPSAKAKGGPR
ncbi:energy transducer TonB [Roseateles oligotrophus]|uniref:TonB C-terminal domain-containing protein n=1 Tax=Roseateles oligotrophus TaxID=1769250 RepID=A0ABT2YEP1_9BURK|nr:hypothetical protein [Roseateles oligotrophus]MCV2368507.1 hypothetical protein [Roseateles oligotrophus]